MRLFLFLFSFFVILAAPLAVSARTENIAAVVNEDAITMSDVEDRMALLIASAGLPNTAEIKSKL